MPLLCLKAYRSRCKTKAHAAQIRPCSEAENNFALNCWLTSLQLKNLAQKKAGLSFQEK